MMKDLYVGKTMKKLLIGIIGSMLLVGCGEASPKVPKLQTFASEKEAIAYLDGGQGLESILLSKVTTYDEGEFDAFNDETKPSSNNENYAFNLPNTSCTIRFSYESVSQTISSLSYSTKGQEDVTNLYSEKQKECFTTFSSMVQLYAKKDGEDYLKKAEEVQAGTVEPIDQTEIYMEAYDTTSTTTYYVNNIYGGFTVTHTVYKSPVTGYFTEDVNVIPNKATK